MVLHSFPSYHNPAHVWKHRKTSFLKLQLFPCLIAGQKTPLLPSRSSWSINTAASLKVGGVFHAQFKTLAISFCTLTGFFIHIYFFSLFFSIFFIFWTQVREKEKKPEASEIQYLYGLWFNSPLPCDKMKHTGGKMHNLSVGHTGTDQMYQQCMLRVLGGTAKPNSKTVPTRIKAIKKNNRGVDKGSNYPGERPGLS